MIKGKERQEGRKEGVKEMRELSKRTGRECEEKRESEAYYYYERFDRKMR